MNSFQYTNVPNFTLNLGQWTTLAKVKGQGRSGIRFTLPLSSGPGPIVARGADNSRRRSMPTQESA